MSKEELKSYKDSPLEYRIYKPNQKNEGAASKVQIADKSDKFRDYMVFWESAKQIPSTNDNSAFGWKDADKKVTMKLEAVDIGEILAVLNGKKDFVGPPPKDDKAAPMGLFHKNEKGNTTFQFKKYEKGGYAIRIASKRGNDLVQIQHLLSYSEGEVLKIILQDALSKMFGWN